MKLFVWQWLVISALLIATSTANADTHPQYGGTLRVAMRASPSSLDPAEISAEVGERNVIALLFDTLVKTDPAGRVQGALAESWQISPSDQHFQMRLRRNIKFHDGTALSAEIAADSLRKANPGWKVTAAADVLSLEPNVPVVELLQELALPRNAIAKRDSGTSISGTGPFHIIEWQPGKKLTVGANEDYWGGRPFLDQVEIEMGRGTREQMNALESGRVDLVEVAPEQMHRVGSQRYQIAHSSPIELVALKFAGDPASAQQKIVRDALRFSIERRSMHSVLLQGAGQETAALLPNWISGYGFVFSTEADLTRARQLRDQVPGVPNLTLGYDNNDPMARLLAERVALNAKDAGLSLQLTPSAADLRLIRIAIASSDPWIGLQALSNQLGLPPVKAKSRSIEDLFATEQAVLATGRIIPLFHLPVAYVSGTALRNWMVTPNGSLDLAQAWLKSQQP